MQAQSVLKKLSTVVQKVIAIENLLRDNGVHLASVESTEDGILDGRISLFAATQKNIRYTLTLAIFDHSRGVSGKEHNKEHDYDFLLRFADHTHHESCLSIDFVDATMQAVQCTFECPQCDKVNSEILRLHQTLGINNTQQTITPEQIFAIITTIAKLFRSAD